MRPRYGLGALLVAVLMGAGALVAQAADEAPDYAPTTPPAGDFRTDTTPSPEPSPTQIRTLHSQ